MQSHRIVRSPPREFKQVPDSEGAPRVSIGSRSPLVPVRAVRIGVAVVLACGLLLVGCATPQARPDLRQPATQSVHPVAPEDDLPLQLIAGELALQRSDSGEAARRYARAATLSADPAIAEQATRLAIAARAWSDARAPLERWRQLAPGARGIVQARAWIALGEGDVETAATELERLLADSGDRGWRAVAQVLAGAADKESAARLLARIASAERLGDREADWLAMSQLALRLGDAALATRLADAARARFDSAGSHAWSARLAMDRGELDLARRHYGEALKRDPDDLRTRTGYAALLGDHGDNAGAARVLAAGPQNDVTLGARAAYLVRADDQRQLAALYREMQKGGADRSAKRFMLLGEVAEILERPPHEAIDWYRAVAESDERWFDAGMRIVVLADRGGDTDAVRTQLAELRAVAGADADRAVDLYLLEAELLLGKSLHAEAIVVYGRGLDQFPGDARLLYARAMQWIDGDELASAERDLREIIAADADNADALNALGYTLADRTDRHAEALELIRRALAIKPDEAAIIDSYGWAHYRLGDLGEAKTQLRRAYAKLPDAEIAAHLGEVLWVDGERDEARRIWDEAGRRDPDNRILAETRQRLDP